MIDESTLRQSLTSKFESFRDSELLRLSPLTASIPYVRKIPTARQRQALEVRADEILYGGAGGGGKTDWALMWILQGTIHPNYAGIIFRRTYPQLTKSADALIPRLHNWLKGTEAKWNGTDRKWTWPNGAVVEFGHLNHETDVYDYQGPSYHRILFEELTQFPEGMYLYLFSRLRRDLGFPLNTGMGATTNPGGIGHGWVRKRFLSEGALDYMKSGSQEPKTFYQNWQDRQGQTITRAFVPARLQDNPHIDEVSYRKNLSHLNPVERARIEDGDWDITEDAQIRLSWLARYRMNGQIVILIDRNRNEFAHFDERECRRFATADPAGTSADKARESRGKPPSWSVIQVWDKAPQAIGPYIMLRHQWRERVGFTDLCDGFRTIKRDWNPGVFHVENEKLGVALVDALHREMNIKTISTQGKDKLTRAAPLLNKLERGEVFLPLRNNDWLPDLEAEWLSWTGHEDEVADQIDPAAYAAILDNTAGVPWGGIVKANRVTRLMPTY